MSNLPLKDIKAMAEHLDSIPVAPLVWIRFSIQIARGKVIPLVQMSSNPIPKGYPLSKF